MPFRLDPDKYGEFRSKIQFTTAAWMPYKIYQACLRTGILSNTAYCQIAVCEKLAKDLDLDLDELLANLPKRRTTSNALFDPTVSLPGPAPARPRNDLVDRIQVKVPRYGMGNTDEEVY